jgi:multicopper oxidase
MLMHDIDRRTVLRTGLAGGLAAASAAVLGGCDSGGTRPGTAYGVTGTARTGPSGAPARAGALVLPGSPLVAQAEQARFTTGRVRSRAIEPVAGEVDLGGPVVRTWTYDGVVPGPVIRVAKGDIVRVTFTSRIR